MNLLIKKEIVILKCEEDIEMKSRELRKMLETMINICDQAFMTGEMKVEAYDRIDKVRKKCEALCDEEDQLDKEVWETEQEFKNYVKGV